MTERRHRDDELPLLVADDDDFSRQAIAIKAGRWGYRVIEAARGDEALAALQGEDAPRLAVLDWMMPGRSGPDICRELRKSRERPYTYLLLLTSRQERSDIVDGLDSGADDYLTKPFDDELLELRLRAGRRIVELQAELMAARDEARHRAEHDALTGLWNRARILTMLEQRLADRRVKDKLAVVLFDLDHFKRLNDDHGHAAGDAALRQVATRVHSVLRSGDGFGRYGGEEFLLVLPTTDAQGARGVADRCRQAIAHTPIIIGDKTLPMTASFGVADATGDDSKMDELLQRADGALYRAKEAGRNRVVVDGEGGGR